MLNAPLTLPSGLRLSNRLAKASMTESLADARGLPTPELLRLYERFAASGAGLLLTGNIVVDGRYPVRSGDVVIDRATPVAALERWAQVARAGSSATIVQINHAGRQTPGYVHSRPLAPSEGPAVKFLRRFGKPRAATEAEIEDVIRRFGDAAERVAAAGFDGVEVHAAHGYLLSQFLSPLVNRRTDRWGGSVENRARLLIACVREVRSRVGARFTVGVKLNTSDFQRGGFSEEDSLRVVQLLEQEGLDFLELSGGTYEQGASFGQFGADARPAPREAYFLEFCRRARLETKAPLLLTGGFRTPALMREVLESGACDLIGLARPLAVTPDLPARILRGEELSARPVAPRTGIEKLNGFAEMAFYWGQMRRMGRGLEPDPSLGPWQAMGQYLWSDSVLARSRRAYFPLNGDVRPTLPASTVLEAAES